VDFKDLAVISGQWLEESVPVDPCKMAWIYIEDPGVDDSGDGIPDHEGFTGYMSKYETTNAQYCEYLNAALNSGHVLIENGDVYGINGSYDGKLYYDMNDGDAQIAYSGSSFYVEPRHDFDMNDHPVVEVSWYGAMAFCDYYGWRLPTEWEWQAVADYNGSYIYGCGTTIDKSKANYEKANPLSLPSYPQTSPVNYYQPSGYGVCDMAGNVWEWTSSLWDPASSHRVLRGGCWISSSPECAVSNRYYYYPGGTYGSGFGFRVCR
jgi:formylglycine-generating enzyme required for sulfatase activity